MVRSTMDRLMARSIVTATGIAMALAALTGEVGAAPAAQVAVPAQPSKTGAPVHPQMTVCWQILDSQRVPRMAIDGAMEDPTRVSGWNQLVTPGKPEGPMNSRRRSLSMLDRGKPYNAMSNGLVFKSGCY